MSGPIATLGYPTRTAAVVALRRQGLTTREIARRIGIEMKTVAALECSAARQQAASPSGVDRALGGVPPTVRQILRPHAARRGLSVDTLMREIVATVACGDLVDAVLDDMGEQA